MVTLEVLGTCCFKTFGDFSHSCYCGWKSSCLTRVFFIDSVLIHSGRDSFVLGRLTAKTHTYKRNQNIDCTATCKQCICQVGPLFKKVSSLLRPLEYELAKYSRIIDRNRIQNIGLISISVLCYFFSGPSWNSH